MTIKEAIVQRLNELCKERGIKTNELAVRSGVTPSTVYSLLDARRKDVSIITLKKLCDGLEIPIWEFFNADVFKSLEQEIK
jgi:transcriptional regulator with XRE-family HTH domain